MHSLLCYLTILMHLLTNAWNWRNQQWDSDHLTPISLSHIHVYMWYIPSTLIGDLPTWKDRRWWQIPWKNSWPEVGDCHRHNCNRRDIYLWTSLSTGLACTCLGCHKHSCNRTRPNWTPNMHSCMPPLPHFCPTPEAPVGKRCWCSLCTLRSNSRVHLAMYWLRQGGCIHQLNWRHRNSACSYQPVVLLELVLLGEGQWFHYIQVVHHSHRFDRQAWCLNWSHSQF